MDVTRRKADGGTRCAPGVHPTNMHLSRRTCFCKIAGVLGPRGAKAAIVEIIRPTEDDVWRVAVDGRCVVAFYGAGGQQLAEYHRDALEELLAADDGGSPEASFPETLSEPIGSRVSAIFPTTIH